MIRRVRYIGGIFAGASVLLGTSANLISAQTDYYNTDLGRPVRIEDASPVERYAFELQLAPLRVERESGGAYAWEVEPELAYGILPRTQLEVGLPLSYVDGPEGSGSVGLAGIAIAALHNLNVETETLPALAVAADVALPVGGSAADQTYASVKGIATRTFGFARFHLNGQYTFGEEPGEGESAGEASRWMAGLAVDRAFPLRSLLGIADVFAEQPLDDDESLEWTGEVGLRYQTSPQFNLDLGVGRRFSGSEQGWFFTVGLAHAFAVRSLMPGR
jgi:hypothetical protein